MINLDHNATTPLDERVLARMLPFLGARAGNASSRDHVLGWDAADAVEEARGEVAALIGAQPRELFFTSGATESMHLALLGLFPLGSPPSAQGVVVTAAEHAATLGALGILSRRGVPTARIPVDASGRIERESFRKALAERRPRAAAIMAANNETGVLQPLAECSALARAAGCLLVCDAAQILGKAEFDVDREGIDLAALSAHKIYGPQGVGALYIRGGMDAIPLEPQMAGGGQEGGLRGGTLNTAGIAGFGEACRIARAESTGETSRLRGLRDRLEAALMARFPDIRRNGGAGQRLANTSNLVFGALARAGLPARDLIRDMHDVAVATRSACSSGDQGPSHVLKAMGLSDDEAFASIRFSLGRGTTESEIDQAVEKVSAAYLRFGGKAA